MFSGIVEAYGKVIGTLSNWMYSYILIILLVGAGIYFTVKTKGVQFRALKEAIKVVMEPKDDEKSISSFQALMVSASGWEPGILPEFPQLFALAEQELCSGCG